MKLSRGQGPHRLHSTFTPCTEEMKSKLPKGQRACGIYLLSITVSLVDCPTSHPPFLDISNEIVSHEAWSASLLVSNVDTCPVTLAVMTGSGLRMQLKESSVLALVSIPREE